MGGSQIPLTRVTKEMEVDELGKRIKEAKHQLSEMDVDSAEFEISADGKPLLKSLQLVGTTTKVAQADPANIQEVAASQLQIINNYYQSVLYQAQRSFTWALIAAGVGLAFFLAAIAFLIFQQPANISQVSLISGALIEVISAINFYLYGRASNQLAFFHNRLDRTQRYLLANSVCENLEGEIKQTTRAELARAMFGSAALGAEEKQGQE